MSTSEETVSEEEIERKIRSKVSGEDIIRVLEGLRLESPGKMSNEEYIEYIVDKVSEEVGGLRIPSEYTRKAYETILNILDETLEQKCRWISKAESERKRAEAWLYECRLPGAEEFYVVKLRVDDLPDYVARSMKITMDRWKAHDEFRRLVETELA